MTDKEKEKLAEFDKLKQEKEKLEKEKEFLKTQSLKNQSQIEQTKIQRTQPNKLIEEVRRKIIQAYNSEEYLFGMYQKLMQNFLSWEEVGNEEQKETIKLVKSEVNKCVEFLERVSNNILYQQN
jgi:hypothetical protein